MMHQQNSIGQTGSAAFPFVLGVMAQKVIVLSARAPCYTLTILVEVWGPNITAVVSSVLDICWTC